MLVLLKDQNILNKMHSGSNLVWQIGFVNNLYKDIITMCIWTDKSNLYRMAPFWKSFWRDSQSMFFFHLTSEIPVKN